MIKPYSELQDHNKVDTSKEHLKNLYRQVTQSTNSFSRAPTLNKYNFDNIHLSVVSPYKIYKKNQHHYGEWRYNLTFLMIDI